MEQGGDVLIGTQQVMSAWLNCWWWFGWSFVAERRGRRGWLGECRRARAGDSRSAARWLGDYCGWRAKFRRINKYQIEHFFRACRGGRFLGAFHPRRRSRRELAVG